MAPPALHPDMPSFDAAVALFDHYLQDPVTIDRHNWADWAAIDKATRAAVEAGARTVGAAAAVFDASAGGPLEAHAVAHGLDLQTWTNWGEQWHAWLDSPPEHTMVDGDWYPVLDSPLPLDRGEQPTARPGAQDDLELDLPHLRRWDGRPPPGGKPVEVTCRFDPTAARAVDAAVVADRAGTLHPGDTAGRLVANKDSTGCIFPVVPGREIDQATSACQGLDRLTGDTDIGLVVGYECALTPHVLAEIEAWLAGNWHVAPALLVPGTAHLDLGGGRVNRATCHASTTQLGEVDKQVPYLSHTSARSDAEMECIDPPAQRSIQVWCGRSARFAVAICRDVIDTGMLAAMERIGVTLLAVPVLDSSIDTQLGGLGSLATRAQTRVVVANAPFAPCASPRWSTAAFLQPIAGRQRALGGPPTAAVRGCTVTHDLGVPSTTPPRVVIM